jgi:flagellar motor switch protein FliG
MSKDEQTPQKKQLTGKRKAAILLRSFSEESAAEVMAFLSPLEIQELSHEIAMVGPVTHEEMFETMNDFFQEVGKFSSYGGGSSDYIRSVLVKVLGEDRASSLLEDITESAANGSGIDAMNVLEPASVAEMIRDEHPQIIATILVHLERGQGAMVLEHFPPDLREDVMLRIATFSGVQPSALQELTEVLSSMLDGQNVKRSKMGGVKTAAEMLNLMNSASEEEILSRIKVYSDDLAQKIVDNMFLFENIIDLDNGSIRALLAEVSTDVLAVSLKGVDQALVTKIVSNMSNRAGQIMTEEMDSMGPVRLSEVEEAQKEILQVIKRLADSGDIVIGGGEDAYV